MKMYFSVHRRCRRKPIIRITPDKYTSSNNKVDFVKVRNVAKRSYSFDDGFTDRISNDAKQHNQDSSESERQQSDRLRNGDIIVSADLRQRCLVSRLEKSIDTNGLRFGIVNGNKVYTMRTYCESTSGSTWKKDRYLKGCEETAPAEEIDDLEGKSVSCFQCCESVCVWIRHPVRLTQQTQQLS